MAYKARFRPIEGLVDGALAAAERRPRLRPRWAPRRTAALLMLYALARPLLFHARSRDGARARAAVLQAACSAAASPGCPAARVPGARSTRWGSTFPNPVGLAAGLDKNGEYIDALAALGFGFIEVGTVTPRPQPGNPRPRLFRIAEREAIINRMGFNNVGVDRLVENVRARALPRHPRHQHRQELRHADRARGRRLPRLPATRSTRTRATSRSTSPRPTRRTCASSSRRDELGRAARAGSPRRATSWPQAAQRRVPLAVKIAPDLDDEQIAAIARRWCEHTGSTR